MRTPNSLSLSAGNLLRGIVKLRQFCFLGKNVKLGRGNRVQPFAVIEDGVTLGNNNFIGYGVILRPEVIIGNNTQISHLSVLEGGTIGNCVRLFTQCHIGRYTTLEDYVFSAPFLITLNVKRPSAGRKFDAVIDGVTIGEWTRIGGNVTFNPGVQIGRECLIGAGSVVTKDLEAYSVAYGNPAKVKGKVPLNERIKI